MRKLWSQPPIGLQRRDLVIFSNNFVSLMLFQIFVFQQLGLCYHYFNVKKNEDWEQS
jgi:hypothetical protein